jgi:hypothetical protein
MIILAGFIVSIVLLLLIVGGFSELWQEHDTDD